MVLFIFFLRYWFKSCHTCCIRFNCIFLLSWRSTFFIPYFNLLGIVYLYVRSVIEMIKFFYKIPCRFLIKIWSITQGDERRRGRYKSSPIYHVTDIESVEMMTSRLHPRNSIYTHAWVECEWAACSVTPVHSMTMICWYMEIKLVLRLYAYTINAKVYRIIIVLKSFEWITLDEEVINFKYIFYFFFDTLYQYF